MFHQLMNPGISNPEAENLLFWINEFLIFMPSFFTLNFRLDGMYVRKCNNYTVEVYDTKHQKNIFIQVLTILMPALNSEVQESKYGGNIINQCG